MKTYSLADGTTIVKIRKARKRYLCPAVWAHDPAINPGEEYARIKITPGMGRGWGEEITMHIDCLEPA